MPYYKTLETLETGPLTWNTEFDIFGTRLEKLLNRPHMTPEVPDGEITAVGGGLGSSQTLTFTAPEDLTIKNLVIYPLNRIATTSTTFINEIALFLLLARMTVVSGTGPDVGVDCYEGLGRPPMAAFSVRNISFVPKLNIRMAAGDVLEIDIEGLTDDFYAYSMVLTYEPGIEESVSPILFLGGTVAPISGGAVGGGTAASATLTVDVASTAETISFAKESSVTNSGLNSSIEGTPGGDSDRYNSTAGSATLIRDDIINVLTVTHSDTNYWSDWTIAPSGGTGITFTRNDVGAGGNYDVIYSATSDFTASIFTGGTSATITLPVASPTVDIVITDIAAVTLSAFSSPFSSSVHGMEIVGIEIDSAPVPIGRGILPPIINRPSSKKVNVPVSAGQTIDLLLRYGGTDTVPIYTLIAAERA